MRTISIVRRKREDRKGYAQLYAVFYVERKKIIIPIGVKTRGSEWSAETGTVRGKSKDAKDANLIIENVRARIADVMVKARLRDEKLTKESFMRYYNNPSDYVTFIDYMQSFANKARRTVSENTMKSYTTIIRKVKGYSPAVTFSELTPDYLKAFLSHLRKLGNSEPTAYKNLALLKVFVMAAERDGYTSSWR